MSVKVKTYVLYGTKVDVFDYDRDRFQDDIDYIDYLYDVVNKDDSPYQVIYNEDQNDYYFGYVIDEASESSWESSYLSTQTFDEIANAITSEVREAMDWLLLIHFNRRSKFTTLQYHILTVYC